MKLTNIIQKQNENILVFTFLKAKSKECIWKHDSFF